MRVKVAIVVAAALLAGVSMSGCYDSAGMTFYEAGVYKGSDDPLLGKLQDTGLQQRLQDRFRAVQTDR